MLASFAVPTQICEYLARPAEPAAPIVERPMPATKEDIEQLRALLRWARSTRADTLTREKQLADGLERALNYLGEPDQRKNVMLWILSALRQSMRKLHGNLWVVTDRDLNDWAMRQLEDMFPDGA